jgi:hypothetical protein
MSSPRYSTALQSIKELKLSPLPSYALFGMRNVVFGSGVFSFMRKSPK